MMGQLPCKSILFPADTAVKLFLPMLVGNMLFMEMKGDIMIYHILEIGHSIIVVDMHENESRKLLGKIPVVSHSSLT